MEMKLEFIKKGGEDFTSCFQFGDYSCWVVEPKGCLTDECLDFVYNEIHYTGGTEQFNCLEEAIERLYEIYSMAN